MLLRVEKLSLAFRRYDGLLRQDTSTVLRDLSFELERGEVLAMVGASGSGKSLLAHALLGILPDNSMQSGTMLLDDVVLDPSRWPDYRGRRIGLVPQSIAHLDPLVRCGRQLAWAAQRCGQPSGRDAVEFALNRYGLDRTVISAFPHQVSGGMARRLLLAIGSIGNPDLIVADEPTSGLDPDNIRRVLEQLRRMANAGCGVLLITHDLALALPFADRVAVLHDGQLDSVEPAMAFSGDGSRIQSAYAQNLWRALPENAFAGVAGDA
jgi:peptide/nickel transport system ATP-binding protein